MTKKPALLLSISISAALWARPARAEPDAPAPSGPLAGFNDGFFIRDPSDNFRLYPRARVNVDFHGFFGPGVADVPAADGGVGLSPRIFVRRLRFELAGDFLKRRVSFYTAVDFGGQPLTNVNGKTQQWASAPGAVPSGASARYAPVESVGATATLSDAWINVRVNSALGFMVGQYQAPFSMENRTGEGLTPFLERNLPIRGFVVPTSKEVGITAWGELGGGLFNYEVGLFGGDGQNRPQVDRRFDFMGRVFVRPLAQSRGPLAKAQVGLSARHGDRDPKGVDYDYAQITSAQSYALWDPTYRDSQKRLVHILPSGAQDAIGGELRLPISRLDIRGEAYYVSNNTREAIDGYQLTNTERLGQLRGVGWYAQVGYWPAGDAFVNGDPGITRPRSTDLDKPIERPKMGFEVLAIVAGVNATYDGASRGGPADAKTPGSAKNPADRITVYQYGVGMNYWATRFFRTTLNYMFYHTPGSGTPNNLAVVPGNLAANPNTGAHVLHELGVRLAIQF